MSLSYPFRMLALLAALASIAAGLIGCGGRGGGPDAQGVLKKAFAGREAIRSGRLDVGLKLDLKGVASLNGPVAIELRGPFAAQGKGELPKVAFDVGLTAGGRQMTFGLTSTGTKGFLAVEGKPFDIGDDAYASLRKGYEEAASSSASKDAGAPGLSALGIDPLRWVRDPKLLGTEDVGGTRARHVSAKVDVPRFLDDLNRLLQRGGSLPGGGTGVVPSPLSAQQRKDIADSITAAGVDVFAGEHDGTLRKLTLDVKLDVPADIRGNIGGLQGGRVGFTLAFAQLNEPQTISAPSGARPISELKGALQQLGLVGDGTSSSSGGASSSGSSSSDSFSAAPSAPAGQAGAYTACLSAAGTDVAKIQACGDLLGK